MYTTQAQCLKRSATGQQEDRAACLDMAVGPEVSGGLWDEHKTKNVKPGKHGNLGNETAIRSGYELVSQPNIVPLSKNYNK